MNLIIHIFGVPIQKGGVPIHRHDSLYGMTKHHGSQIKLSVSNGKVFSTENRLLITVSPFNYGIAITVSRKF